MSARQEQPLAVAALVLPVILQQTLRDLLIVRVVAEPRRHQRETLDEMRAVCAAVEVGFGPGHGRGRVERSERRLQAFDDLACAHSAGAARNADLV